MSQPTPQPTPDALSEAGLSRSLRHHTLALIGFWLLLGAALWLGFSWWEARQRAPLLGYALSDGELAIPRSPDGHFYVAGEVNRQPVQFMVDTGASGVAVSDALARRARLPAGQPIIVSTANGEREGRRIHNVPVRAGHLARNDVSVVTGLRTGDDQDALLGQSFLRHFDVRIEGDTLRLRTRPDTR